MNNKECVFCKMSCGEIEIEKIYENDNFFSIKDIHPKTEGHCLIISKNHYDNSLDMPSSLGGELMDCIKNTYLKLNKDLKSEGFNIVNNNFSVAGQEIKHVHFHILPRKKDDGFRIFKKKEVK